MDGGVAGWFVIAVIEKHGRLLHKRDDDTIVVYVDDDKDNVLTIAIPSRVSQLMIGFLARRLKIPYDAFYDVSFYTRLVKQRSH